MWSKMCDRSRLTLHLAVQEDSPRSLSPLNASTPETVSQQPSRPITPLPKHPSAADQSAENIEAQEAYLRALLRSKQSLEQPQDSDPTTQLLSSFMNMDSSSPDAPALPDANILSQSLTSSLGLPSSVANLVTQQLQPDPPEEQQKNVFWQMLHTVVAFLIGIWLVITYRTSIMTYGNSPPPPAAMQNPFSLFLTAEIALGSARLLTRNGNGQLRSLRPWLKVLSTIVRDGKIVLFFLGLANVWMNVSERNETKS